MKKINDKKIININGLIDEDKCHQNIRELRCPKNANCPWHDSSNIVKTGVILNIIVVNTITVIISISISIT